MPMHRIHAVRKRSRVPALRLSRLFSTMPGRVTSGRDTWARVLAIDPGLEGTGWALWESGHGDCWYRPFQVGVIRGKAKDDTLAARCQEISTALAEATGWRRSTAVIIELPQHMASAKGIAAQSGAIYKLTFLAGYLARELWPAEVFVVNPGQWKGQLPKSIIQSRVERILTKRICTGLGVRTHAWDAVGIGLWAMGKM